MISILKMIWIYKIIDIFFLEVIRELMKNK